MTLNQKVFNITTIAILLITTTPTLYSQKRQMRAVWIATVANIDWPSAKNLDSKNQQNEMIKMLDEFQANNINAIFIQIRPTADAFYPSSLEPWSHWLTGKQGQAPKPPYDPLLFVISEAHKRCIEVHAWLNPYRVTNGDDTNILAKNHLFRSHPELFVHYGGKYYFNPALDETRQHLNKVVAEIVQKYDIDAIHFDDYFYPYKVGKEEFPDDESFRNLSRGYTSKDDWRRNNVNMVIKELSKTIKSIKPWVEFGISPFGVWRNSNVDPKGSATKAGVQNYDDLYADILKWLKEGSIDYVVPQLYWEIGKKNANYEVLAHWWAENSFGKNLYIGLYNYQLGQKEAPEAWRRGNELTRQLNLNSTISQIDGVAFYNANSFMKNKLGLNDSLKNHFFKYPALNPINRNIKTEKATPPQNVKLTKEGNNHVLTWETSKEKGGNAAAYYVIYKFRGNKIGDLDNAENIVAKTTETSFNIGHKISNLDGYSLVVTAVNRYKLESEPAIAKQQSAETKFLGIKISK